MKTLGSKEKQMSPDYAKYSERELFDVLGKIDKQKHPENYSKLMLEFAARHLAVGSTSFEENQRLLSRPFTDKSSSRQKRKTTPCSWQRVTTILLAGVLITWPIVMSMKPATSSDSNKQLLLILVLLVGIPLMHSFVFGWTISRLGIVSLQTDKVGLTIMQLFYSFILGITIWCAILR